MKYKREFKIKFTQEYSPLSPEEIEQLKAAFDEGSRKQKRNDH